MLRRIVAASLIMVGASAFADTLDINLSKDAAQFKYTLPSGIAGKSDLFTSLTYNDVGDLMLDGGLMVLTEEGTVPGLSLGFGAKAVAASLDNIALSRKEVAGVALGTQVRYELPADRRFALVGEFHYAPGIISFGDLDHFTQGVARGEFAMSPLIQVYVGYRYSKFFMDKGFADSKVDNDVHIGMRLAF